VANAGIEPAVAVFCVFHKASWCPVLGINGWRSAESPPLFYIKRSMLV